MITMVKFECLDCRKRRNLNAILDEDTENALFFETESITEVFKHITDKKYLDHTIVTFIEESDGDEE